MTPMPRSDSLAKKPPRVTRRRLLQVLVRSGIGACAASLGGLAYAHEVEPVRLRINRQDLRIPGLPQAFDGLRIAHLTDIHLDPWMDAARIARACRLANSLSPDLIAITGDFVSRDSRPRDARGEPIGDALTGVAPGLAESLSILQAPLGVWGVLGNHDHWASREGDGHADQDEANGHDANSSAKLGQVGRRARPIMSRVIAEGGVRELDNKIAPIERGGERLWLCGVDDYWSGDPDPRGVLRLLEEQARPGEIAILLLHEPDAADIMVGLGRFSLQLSGHSHGGQVNIPLVGPLILPALGQKYHTGLYHVAARGPSSPALQVFTSRGVGVVNPRVRFNCPPEIALLTLHPA